MMPDPFRVEQSLDSTAFGGGRSNLNPGTDTIDISDQEEGESVSELLNADEKTTVEFPAHEVTPVVKEESGIR